MAREIKKEIIPKDGPGIMKKVSERDRVKDYIISRSWEVGRHSMKNIEKRIYLDGKEGFIDKTIIKYIDPPAQYGTSILIWNHQKRERAFWFKTLHSSPSRISDTERIRPTAEADFCLTDYIDLNVDEETHRIVKSEVCGEKRCYVIESVPIARDAVYGKRKSWIEQTEWLPHKIEYYDKRGSLWKTALIEWQRKFDVWFWRNVVVENTHTNSKTTIVIDDVRVNVGLDEKDFTRHGLEQKKHGF